MRVMTPSTARMVVALTMTSKRGQPASVDASVASAMYGFARGSPGRGKLALSCLQSKLALSEDRPATRTTTVELCSSSVRAMAEPTVP